MQDDARSWLRLSPARLCVLDSTGLVVEISAMWAAEIGRSADVLIGTPFVDLIHPDDAAVATAGLERAREGASPVEMSQRFVNGGGGHLRLRWRATAPPGERHLLLALQDELEEDFGHHDELRRFRAIVEAFPDLVGIATMEARTIYMNPAGERLLQLQSVDYHGWSILDFTPQHVHERYMTEIVPAVMRDGRWEGETEFQQHDGTILPVWQAIFVIPDAAGRPERLATRARDLSSQKSLEAALRRSIEALSTPIIQIWEGVLALPVIGALDGARAERMMATLLDAIAEQSCRIAIIDVTGVKSLDASTIEHLLRMVRATSLLGSRCLISGISPAVAQTATTLGIDLSGLQFFRSLKECLRFTLQQRGAAE